ncbi:MAG: hypothetical protein RMX68_000605 [Aulosira sp. ZfuVER01]|nr:hypothetical protein [Aulosira sp. ZfuVER01]MDZ7998255.1 hypothetical protein [Aulosira sp. DedVER01a]MDZ8055499.1 hypothetical protein [Aulosira sp. ZfuCHP01]
MLIQGTLMLIPGTRNTETGTLKLIQGTLMLLQASLKLLSLAYLQNIFCVNAIAQQMKNDCKGNSNWALSPLTRLTAFIGIDA